MALVDDLYAASANAATTDTTLAGRIQKDMREINMRRVSSKLFSVGLAHRHSRVEALLNEAEKVGLAGRAGSPNLLVERLKSVERLHSAVCKLESLQEDEIAQVDGPAESTPLTRFVEELGTTARMAILVGLTSVLILLVVVSHQIYIWAYALLNNRRACRIAASLEQGLDVVDGSVTILGKKGCRFQPVNKGAHARAHHMVGKQGVFLVVGRQRLLIGNIEAYGFFLGMFFDRPLDCEAHEGLLSLSTIPPCYVPKSRRAEKLGRHSVQAREPVA